MDWAVIFGLLAVVGGVFYFAKVDSYYYLWVNKAIGIGLVAGALLFTYWRMFGTIGANEVGLASLHWNYREAKILPPNSDYVVPPWIGVERFPLNMQLESREIRRGDMRRAISQDGTMAILRVEVSIQLSKPQYAGLLLSQFGASLRMKERLDEAASFAAARTTQKFTLAELKSRSSAVGSFLQRAMLEELVLLLRESDEFRQLPGNELLSVFSVKGVKIRDVISLD